MDQVLSTFSFTEDTIVAAGHPAVILAGKINADQGELAAGTLLGRSATDLIPYEPIDEVVATGDGTTATFAGTISHAPVHPGSLSITDTVETFTDDGHGHLTGDAGGTGTINYTTGAFSATFNAAPANGTDITATNHNQLVGPLEKQVDTTKETACNYVAHGSVREDRLIVGAAGDDPTATDMSRLIAAGIFPA